ncbi:hypothetical protein Tco_0892052 [Tanacetum coccineum]|uniref:Uncharacterized protein n=1 Tax=Tanacetum coccineum TaxID=301880 RepID=A0ABQ5C4Z3_9ASTR
MTSKAQQIELDNALVALENRRVIGKCNMRINPGMKPKEPTYQVALDALARTTCYHAFLITTEVPVIYMHQFWATVTKHKSSYRFKIDNKKFSVNVEVFRDILNICLRIHEIEYITDVIVDHLHQPWRTFASIINKCLCGKKDLAYQIDNIDSKKQDKMFYPRFTNIIIHHFLEKDKTILMRNRMFMDTVKDDDLLGIMRFVTKHADTQVYGEILPQAMTNQALLDSVAYKTYYAIALGAEPLMSRKIQKKSDSAISSEESPSKKKSTKVKKVATAKPKPTNKKAPVKADRGKGLNVVSEGDNGEEDEDDKNDSEDKSDDGDDDDDGNDDDDDNDDANDEITKKSSTEYYEEEEEEEKIDDEETMDDEEDDEVTKELYKDVNVNLGNEDTEMTDADQGGSEKQNVRISQKSQENSQKRANTDTRIRRVQKEAKDPKP